jgi:hypothetical protein
MTADVFDSLQGVREFLSPDDCSLIRRLKGADDQWRDFTPTGYRQKDPS